MGTFASALVGIGTIRFGWYGMGIIVAVCFLAFSHVVLLHF